MINLRSLFPKTCLQILVMLLQLQLCNTLQAMEVEEETRKFEEEFGFFMNQSSDPFPILPEQFILKQLRLRDLHGEELEQIPSHIFELTKLKELNLADNRLSEIPLDLGKLSNLKILGLSNNKFWKFPAEVMTLSKLKRLYLGANFLHKMPVEILKLSNLQILYLCDNAISEIPQHIGNLSNLQELYLGSNFLKEISPSIGNLTKLNHLSLFRNKLIHLPGTIGLLKALRLLDLSGNNLLTDQRWAKSLGGKELGEFLSLAQNFCHEVEIQFNHYQLVPIIPHEDDPCQFFTYKLIQLITSSNFESEAFQMSIFIPKTITIGGKSCNINEHHLGLYSQDSLPKEILLLKKLNRLKFSYNTLTSVPSSIGQLSNLTSLNFYTGQLSEIPSSIGNLTNLKKLYINRTQLRYLPWSLANLTSLKLLSLVQNKFLNAQQWAQFLKGHKLTACLKPAHDLVSCFKYYLIVLAGHLSKDSPFCCFPMDIIKYILFIDFDVEAFQQSVFYREKT